MNFISFQLFYYINNKWLMVFSIALYTLKFELKPNHYYKHTLYRDYATKIDETWLMYQQILYMQLFQIYKHSHFYNQNNKFSKIYPKISIINYISIPNLLIFKESRSIKEFATSHGLIFRWSCTTPNSLTLTLCLLQL